MITAVDPNSFICQLINGTIGSKHKMQKRACIFGLQQQLEKHYTYKIMTCNLFQPVNYGQHKMNSLFLFCARGTVKYRFRA